MGLSLPPRFSGGSWCEMSHAYQGRVEGGVRRIPHVGKKGITREGLEELAWIPGPFAEPARGYADTFKAEAETGFWKARARPRFDKRVETGMIKAVLEDGLAALTSGGETTAPGVAEDPVVRANGRKPEYPTGKPLNPSELREKWAPMARL